MNLASGMRRWTLLPLLALALYVAPRVVSMLVFLATAFIVYLALAAVQSLFEMSRVVSSTLLSVAASAFYHGRYHQAHLLLAGFRGDAVRRIPASAYLHTTYGLDRSLCDELGTLINILAGDFITSWYKNLTTDDVFPTTVKLLLCDLLGGLCVRIKRHLDLHGCLSLVTEVLQVVQLHLAWFRELYVALADEHPHIFGDDSHASIDLRRRLLLECVVTNHPKLHPGCLPTGGGYLKHISKQMLVLLRPDFDDKNTSTLMTFPSLAWHFTSEIVANCVLTPLLAYCNPIYLNPIVASALEPLQAKEIDVEAKRPLASYTASHIAKSAAMIDDVTLVDHLVSLMNEMELTTPEPLLPISPPQQFNLPSTTTTTATTTPKAKMSKHKKTLSLLDVSKMKARFRRRLHSNTSERSDTELSKSDCEPSIGHDLITQLDHAVDLFLNLNARADGGASRRSRELHGLISALEEVLLFGLKTQSGDENTSTASSSSSSSYWSYINQRRAQAAFWNDRLDWIHSLPSPRISDGHFSPRGVQWLLLALEEGELWEFFTAMTLDMDMTQVYYEPYAILRERELCVLLLASLFRLNGLRVALLLQPLGHDRVDDAASRFDASNPFAVSTVVEEAWESERYLPLQGWTKSSDKRKRSDERLPSTEWFWETPWTLEECPEDSAVDEKSHEDRGWQYSKTSKEVGFHSKESMLDCIRRRKWRRVRKTLPLLLVPEDPPTSASNNQDKEKPVKVQEVAACFRCRRGLESSSASHACPTCLKTVCFSCSNHCVEVANVKQRVCSTCYEQHVATLRLQLSVRVARVDTTTQDAFLLQVVTADGHQWNGVKTWADIEALNVALMEQPHEFVDPGEWRRMSPYFLRPLGMAEEHVNRFLDELLKCHQLSQTHAVQTFLLDVATPPEGPAETKDIKVPSLQTTRQGQILLQKLEIQAFKMMDELFELDEMNRMRRRLLSVTRTFIRVSLNATCHRIVEAQFVELTQPKKIAAVLCDVRTMAIPPDGIYYRDEPPPSAFQIHDGMRACRSALLRCCPPAFVSLLGDTATHNGCLKIFEFLQHEVLVKNLALSLLDVLLQRIFPEMPPWTQPKKAAALGKSRCGS